MDEASRHVTSPEGRLRVSRERLEEHVRILEGERHPVSSPDALQAASFYIQAELASQGLAPAREVFLFRGESHENIVARKPGADPRRPSVLVGAHYDTVRGSPGADDNASGVAALLEVARVLAPEELEATVEFVAFNLEEQQGTTYRVGSSRYVREARREGVRYAGALIFEMVGFTREGEKSQRIPWMIRWMRLPRKGDFVAAVSDGQSRHLLKVFDQAAREAAPRLRVVTFRSPFRGWLVPHTRLSDNASFWSEGYPALMITDTAFLRNPHYHKPSDRIRTLDFEFMTRVAETTAETVRKLATPRLPGAGG